jgi:hypothetical protein
MTRSQERMALAAVAAGIGLQQPRHPVRGTALDSRIHSRARAARVFAFTFFAAFGVATAIPLIILAHLIDWTGVAESIGLY